MKRIALFLSFIVILSALCSCADINARLNPRIENVGEVITMPRDQTTAPDTDGDTTADTAAPGPEDDMPFGSAGTLSGKSIVISVFANDADTAWSDWDTEVWTGLLDKVRYACDWISAGCAEYQKTYEFIFDWQEDAALRYDVSFDSTMVVDGPSTYETVSKYVSENIDTAALLEKYGAENVLYLFFYNTLYTNQIRPCSVTHADGADFDTEYVTVPVRYERRYDVSPTALAREMLCCFGAYDLSSADSGIPQSYVDHCLEIGSDDIMYEVNDWYEITGRFTELTAYYTGLVDECAEVAEWKLPVAERFGK